MIDLQHLSLVYTASNSKLNSSQCQLLRGFWDMSTKSLFASKEMLGANLYPQINFSNGEILYIQFGPACLVILCS